MIIWASGGEKGFTGIKGFRAFGLGGGGGFRGLGL